MHADHFLWAKSLDRTTLSQDIYGDTQSFRCGGLVRRKGTRNARTFLSHSNHQSTRKCIPSSLYTFDSQNSNPQISIVQQTRMASPSATLFREILLPHTLSILQSLLLSIAGGVPRSHLTSLSELLHACILRIPEETRGGLKMLLGQEGWPSERATGEVKMKFVRAVLS